MFRKFNNKKIEAYGYRFDSKLEKTLFDLLKMKEKCGEIRELTHHSGTIFLSKARIQYRPDFRFINNVNDVLEYAESKGYETSDWRIKRKLWIAYGPSKLYIYKGSHKSLKLYETLSPGDPDDL